ncbi:hypothetical protein BKA56DRAFT_598024 [Ilyonectria sp. MPI-CAGE-AT-0026]|nr:hypothetical protein BKA56DRAFT_598024 [Ilyonectria sp. MPI-CAGE-AT-0026]
MQPIEDGDEEITHNSAPVDPAIIPSDPPQLPLEGMSWKQSLRRRIENLIHPRYIAPWRVQSDASQRNSDDRNMESTQLGVDPIMSSTQSFIGIETSQTANCSGVSTATSILEPRISLDLSQQLPEDGNVQLTPVGVNSTSSSVPSSIGTVITQITNYSGLSTATSASEAPVFQDSSQRPINPTHVKLFKSLKAARVYLAEGDDAKIPSDVMEQWNTMDFGRLMTDLTEVTMDIYRKSIDRGARSHATSKDHNVSFELRMSGRAPRDARCITLVPSVWILCGSRWACKHVKAAMNDITWLMLPFEVHEGSPELASVEETIDVKTLDLTNGIWIAEGVTLYINVEIPPHDTITASGLLCCSTIRTGDTYLQHIGRIGGVISINGEAAQYGVTTAHGMLNTRAFHNHQSIIQPRTSTVSESAPSKADNSDNTTLDYEAECESEEEESNDDTEGEASDDDTDIEDHDVNSPGYIGFRDPLLVSEWSSVSSGILNFLGESYHWDFLGTRYNQADPSLLSPAATEDTDHALLPLNVAAGLVVPNTYHEVSVQRMWAQAIQGYKKNADLIEGPVIIALGAQPTVEGELLLGPTCLAVHGQMFSLRKIKFASRLAPGTSGSWVVRDSFLCGMIVAVSRTEPYALMMTAERLFWNIKSWDRSIHQIELDATHRATGLISSNKVKGLGDPIRLSTRVLANRKTEIAMAGLLDDEYFLDDSARRGLGSVSPKQHPEAIGDRNSLVNGKYSFVEEVYILARLVLLLSVLALFAYMITVMSALIYSNSSYIATLLPLTANIYKSSSYATLVPVTAMALALLIAICFLRLARFREVGKNIVIGMILAIGILTLVSVISATAFFIYVPPPHTVSDIMLMVLGSLITAIVVWFYSRMLIVQVNLITNTKT